MESSVMVSLFLFESDVYWKIWGIEMFNQCSPDYFPPFRVMLWACDCPTLCECVHGCELSRNRCLAAWCILFYAFILCALWDSLTFPIRRHCLQLLITLLNFVAVWDGSYFPGICFRQCFLDAIIYLPSLVFAVSNSEKNAIFFRSIILKYI